MLHFGHRHVFRTHHHRNATGKSVGRNLVYGVPPRGPSFRANNIVFYFGGIEGELRALTVLINEGAKVEGDIVAEELTISGQVKGTIHANRVKLNSTAVVEGDIFHRSLSIEENARFEGSSKREDKAVDVPRTPLRRPATQDDLQTGVTAIQGNGKSNGARDKDAYADAGAS